MRALISGRFDPPHCGHVKTILDIGDTHGNVTVVVLDHEGQKFESWYRAQILREILERDHRGAYTITVNTTHFGNITKEELDSYGCEVYCGGNEEVNERIKSLGMTVINVPRSYDFSASTYRKGMEVEKG